MSTWQYAVRYSQLRDIFFEYDPSKGVLSAGCIDEGFENFEINIEFNNIKEFGEYVREFKKDMGL